MNKFLIIGCVGLCLTACTSTEKGAGIGAATGAVVGGVATGNVGGAVVGGVSGALIGNVAGQPGRCYYRDSDGNRYVDRC
ncbi:glycine zipper family protein [Rhizobium pusense]|uniref:glycine zipper family protein n=1 Tax=Agrobacterium pusense TaxID=648995 RepID=UPI000D1ABF70|nr:glycine zipper family protein [Agrobacterium pusense]MDH0911751.1 glycine zipper family protein [Agrobacterium pusense]MDH1097822.1 glycine zipper family protein [Agrobacterium pusense]MDH1114243.1 glycine zipper family protein [Agrobacterium pusense]MDH2196379.1 glycine zipper family protein [Agrobacterium pusense]